MAAELKSLIEEFQKFDKNSVIKAFQVEDKVNNSKLYDKILKILDKFHDHWNGIEKVEGNDLICIFRNGQHQNSYQLKSR